jgi:hypothetical protein
MGDEGRSPVPPVLLAAGVLGFAVAAVRFLRGAHASAGQHKKREGEGGGAAAGWDRDEDVEAGGGSGGPSSTGGDRRGPVAGRQRLYAGGAAEYSGMGADPGAAGVGQRAGPGGPGGLAVGQGGYAYPHAQGPGPGPALLNAAASAAAGGVGGMQVHLPSNSVLAARVQAQQRIGDGSATASPAGYPFQPSGVTGAGAAGGAWGPPAAGEPYLQPQALRFDGGGTGAVRPQDRDAASILLQPGQRPEQGRPAAAGHPLIAGPWPGATTGPATVAGQAGGDQPWPGGIAAAVASPYQHAAAPPQAFSPAIVAAPAVQPGAVVPPPVAQPPQPHPPLLAALARYRYASVQHGRPLWVPPAAPGQQTRLAAAPAAALIDGRPADAAATEPAPAPEAASARLPSAYFEIEYSALAMGPLIGMGAFGQVHRARWRGTDVAVKSLTCTSIDSDTLEDFRAEVAVLSALRHPNILLFMGACTVAPHYCLVTELMPRGSLWALLHTRAGPRNSAGDGVTVADGPLPWVTVRSMALDVARGMAYLHGASPAPLLHRDLKSGNLLVDAAGGVKIADFGLARVKAAALTMTGGAGTIQWTSPEVLANHRYTERADVYSFAVVCWELLTRECPYGDMAQIAVAMAVLNTGLRPAIPAGAQPEFATLIAECWATDPAARPDFLAVIARLEAMPAAP